MSSITFGEARPCAERRDWPYSSFHRAVRDGLYPMDWAGNALENDAGSWGE